VTVRGNYYGFVVTTAGYRKETIMKALRISRTRRRTVHRGIGVLLVTSALTLGASATIAGAATHKHHSGARSEVVLDARQAAQDAVGQANETDYGTGGSSGGYVPPFDAQIVMLNQAMDGFVDPTTKSTYALTAQVFAMSANGGRTTYLVELAPKFSAPSYACAQVDNVSPNRGTNWTYHVVSGRCH
jgi:hypothetical protein